MSIELKHSILGTVIIVIAINLLLLVIWGLNNYGALCCTDPIIIVIAFPTLYVFAKMRYETEFKKIGNIINNDEQLSTEKVEEIQSKINEISTSAYKRYLSYFIFIKYFLLAIGIILFGEGILNFIIEKRLDYSSILLGILLIISYYVLNKRNKLTK
jgi:hypothetical protein